MSEKAIRDSFSLERDSGFGMTGSLLRILYILTIDVRFLGDP
jgi:hypothetical protein